MTNLFAKLKKLEIFEDLSDLEIKEICPQFEVIELRRRLPLFKENTPIQFLYYTLYGSVKIQHRTERNEDVIFNFLGRDEFLGVAMAGQEHAVFPASVVALEHSAFLKFSLSFYNNFLVHLPAVRRLMSRQVSERFLEFQADRCISDLSATQKVADLFLRLLFRQKESCPRQITIPLSRHDVALRIGAQPETVIRIISQWTKEGLIQTTDRHIEALDITKLKSIRQVTARRPRTKSAFPS